MVGARWSLSASPLGDRVLRTGLGRRAPQAGLVVGAAQLPATFQRTLMPRSTVDQALVTGLSFALHDATATLLQETVQSIALVATGRGGGRVQRTGRTWSGATIAVDALAAGVGLAAQRLAAQRDRESMARAVTRSAGYLLSTASAAGAVVGILQEVGGRRQRGVPLPVLVPAVGLAITAGVLQQRRSSDGDPTPVTPAGAALGLGVSIAAAALAGGEAALARRVGHLAAAVLPGNEAVWRPLGHVVTLAALGIGVRRAAGAVFRGVEHNEVSVEAAYDIPPLRPELSGSLDSVVDFDTLSKQGRRYVWAATPTSSIERVMGEPSRAHPIRVYVGLESAPTDDERVDLAMRELERTGAFDRPWLLVDVPTGTGYVNYAAVNVLELLSRGNCATVSMQYAERPSVMSLDRVGEGHRHTRLLLERINARPADAPSRPTVVLFGESLGAWASQDAVIDRGTQGLVELGVDRAIWIGTPHFSKWKDQVLGSSRPDVDRSLVGVFDGIDGWRALPEDERTAIRYVMITHTNDGVALFGPQLLVQAPTWLTGADRPSRVPRSMRWIPFTTFVQVFVDMKNSANVVPGVLAATGHDYRADLLPFFHEVLGSDATAEQLDAVATYLADNELGRSRWNREHVRHGDSMAAQVVRSWMREHPDQVEQALGPRLRALAADGSTTPAGTASPRPTG